MDRIKGLLLKFVKPLVLAHVKDLSMLMPVLSKVLAEKTHMTQDQANALASDLIAVIEGEIVLLVNKI